MKNKILSWITGIFILGILVLQFTIPFATLNNGLNISAFSTALKYGNIDWAFNFFWIIVAILVVAVSVICVAKAKHQTHGKLYVYLSLLFGAGFMIGIAVLASLQSFIQANPNIGVTDNAGDGILTFFAFFALFFLQMPRYNVYTEQEAEKKLNVGGLEDFLKAYSNYRCAQG